MYFRKSISPVVATALLLVVAVVAVTSFQSWFTTFQSGVNVVGFASNQKVDMQVIAR